MSDNENTTIVEAEYEWVYEITGPNGRVLLRTLEPNEAEDGLYQFQIKARQLDVNAVFTMRRRKRLTAAYLSEWETVNV
jgi:hypothetical protein